MRTALALLLGVALAACAPRAPEPGPLLPGLAGQLPGIESIELRGAGDGVVATLERGADGWRVRERDGWRADRKLVRALLADLAGARRTEPRTDRPDKYARIGVEPLDAAEPTSAVVEVRMRGNGWERSLLVGEVPRAGLGRFVRVTDEPQAWLVDRDFAFPRTPEGWLDTRLVQVPIAFVVGVDSRDDAGHAFALDHRDDRFRVAGLPSAAMGDSYRGDELAGVLEDLRLADVAADTGQAAERTVRFTLRDATALEFQAFRIDGRAWVRVRECRGEACAARAEHAGRRFLLPPHLAVRLLLTRDQVLAKTP